MKTEVSAQANVRVANVKQPQVAAGVNDLVERAGQVVGFERGQALVRVENASACGSCGSRGACASGAKAAPVIRMALPAGTQVGDRVAMAMPAASVAQAAVLGYLLPPACLLAGAIVGEGAYGGDAAAAAGAGLGLIAGLLLARLISHFALGRGVAPAVCGPDSTYGDLT